MSREEVATHLMAALLTRGLPDWAPRDAKGERDWTVDGYAKSAVIAADALLGALDGPQS